MFKLNRDDTALLIIDIQKKIVKSMDEEMLDTVVNNAIILTKAFQIMRLPIIESLQYPKGLGDTVDELSDEIEAVLKVEKTTFSAYKDDSLKKYLKDNKVKNIILVGMEAHVCVLQTALDLIDAGYNTHIVADAVISRNDFNWETGLDFMQKAGAVITVTEIVIFQLLGSSEALEFKDVQKLLK